MKKLKETLLNYSDKTKKIPAKRTTYWICIWRKNISNQSLYSLRTS